MTLRLVFAHGPLGLPSRHAPPGSEARVRLSAAVVDEARNLEAWRAVPRARRLGDVRSPWIGVDVPHDLEALLASLVGAEEAVEAAVPAAVQAELERHAPRTWQRLLTRTRVLARDGAWQVARADGVLRVLWRPAGDGASVERTSPLLALADHVVRGRLPGHNDPPPAALALLRRLLEARWIERRLPPELAFDAERGAVRLRLAPMRATLIEIPRDEGGDGHALRLEVEGGAHLRLEAAPGQGVPGRVARAALAWLFAGPRADASLFLDTSGNVPTEPPRPAREPAAGAFAPA